VSKFLLLSLPQYVLNFSQSDNCNKYSASFFLANYAYIRKLIDTIAVSWKTEKCFCAMWQLQTQVIVMT